MQKLYDQVTIHALTYLLIACFIGILLSLLIVCPELDSILGRVTYGKLIPLHLNLQLYGWFSLPIIGLLFKVFGVSERFEKLSVLTIYLWGFSLFFGCISWLAGENSGKVFLEWKGLSRYIFITNLSILWICMLLNYSYSEKPKSKKVKIIKSGLLIFLLFVPISIFMASDPRIFPPINVSSSGATGSSLVMSSLFVIFICVVLPPYILKQRAIKISLILAIIAMIINLLIWITMNHKNSSHYDFDQRFGMTSLLVWIPILINYYYGFSWEAKYNLWLKSLCFWGVILISTAIIMFSPSILDKYKFSSLIVAHVHIAMAGFLNSLMFIILLFLTSDQKKIDIISNRSVFLFWNIGLLGHIIALTLIAQVEAIHYGVGYISGSYVYLNYLRLFFGIVMTSSALYYFIKLISLKYKVI